MNNERDKNEILQAISAFAESVDERFNQIDERFDQIAGRFNQNDSRFDKIDSRFDRLEGRVARIEATMVTKDYLDVKLADHYSDLVMRMRREDEKVIEAVNKSRK